MRLRDGFDFGVLQTVGYNSVDCVHLSASEMQYLALLVLK